MEIQLIPMRSFLSIIELVNIKTLMYLFKTHNIIILFVLLIGCQSSNPAKSISADNPVAIMVVLKINQMLKGYVIL